MTGALLLSLAAAMPAAAPVVAAASAGDQPVASAALQTSAPTPEALAEAYYEFLHARSLQDTDAEAAAAALQRAIALVPRAAELHAELAATYASLGRAFDAVTAAEAALAIEPENVDAHRIMGYVQAAVSANIPSPADRATMMDQAIGHFERAIAAGGGSDLGLRFRLAEVYLARGRAADAERAVRAFLEEQPAYPDAWALLAQTQVSLDRTDEAIDALQQFVRLAPDRERERQSLARLLESAGRWTEAADQWARLADRPGDNQATFRLYRATALANGGEVGAARALLVGLTSEQPGNATAWYLLSQIELRQGRPDDAEQAARQIAVAAPDDPRALVALADVAAARDDFAEVIAIVRPRVENPPAADLSNGIHGRLAGTMAGAMQERGDHEGAVRVMEAASRRAPDDRDLMYNLGTSYERAGQLEDARRTLRGLIALEPEHADALNYLGYMLADSGQQLDEALALVERALAIEPANPSFLDSLGWAYFRLGRFDEALVPLESAASRMADASVVQDHLGDLYFQLKRYRDAVTAYDRALAGDRVGVDVDDVTRKRNRARDLAGR